MSECEFVDDDQSDRKGMNEIVIQAHQEQWWAEFEKERIAFKSALGTLVVATHHIGSTSVPGLVAKPIIDIVLEVKSLTALDEKCTLLTDMGYEAMGEFGIARRCYYRKGQNPRTHHIHAFEHGDPHIVRHLAFRDYLIAHPTVRQVYGNLKTDLAKRFKYNSEAYCAGKDEFIKHHETLALAWLQKR